MKNRVVVAFFALVMSGLSVGTAQAATILVFGDSISAAYGLKIEEGWVALLQNKLDKQMPGKHKVVNASLSGETSSGGKLRLPPLLAKHKPDLMVLELGANDGLRGQPPKLMAANLRQMITEAKKAGATVLLMGMKIPPNYGRVYNEQFEKAFVDVSQSEKVTLLPFFMEGVAGVPALTQPDGLHPVAAAQPRLLANVWPLIEAQLKGEAKPKRK